MGWITRFILFHRTEQGSVRHPGEMGSPEIEAFLTHLAIEVNVAASTQNQALSALLFLYRHVLEKELESPSGSVWARKPRRLPTVLTRQEVRKVTDCMSGTYQLMARLLYGSGMRLMEGVRLRVKDLDFGQRQIVVRDGKGMEDRVTTLPESLVLALQEHLRQVKQLHEQDLGQGYGRVYLPFALEPKVPNADCEWARM